MTQTITRSSEMYNHDRGCQPIRIPKKCKENCRADSSQTLKLPRKTNLIEELEFMRLGKESTSAISRTCSCRGHEIKNYTPAENSDKEISSGGGIAMEVYGQCTMEYSYPFLLTAKPWKMKLLTASRNCGTSVYRSCIYEDTL